MTSPNTITCYLVGVESLLAECGTLLRERGAQILGVVSDAPLVAQWARDQEIPLYDLETFEDELRQRPCDYLFAIGQYETLPEAVLAAPRQAAINFHDGPLPRYAGLNVPVWAIVGGEPTHGITWHELRGDGHSGRILDSRSFDLADDETTLTLNAKCFEAALASLRELLPKLERAQLAGEPPAGSGRHFDAWERPASACTLDWRKPAAELERLVRALDFGPYANDMGAAKLVSGDCTLVVTRAEATEAGDRAEPGTIVGLDGDALVVATSDGDLRIEALATLAGEPLELSELGSRWGLTPGSRLERLDDAVAERLTALGPALAEAERLWSARLKALEPYRLPYAFEAVDDPGHDRFTLALAPRFAERFGTQRAALLGACLTYLARLSAKWSFHVGFSGPRTERDADLARWLVTRVPMQVDLAPEGRFEDALGRLEDELARVADKPGWLRDLVGRDPELKGKQELLEPGLFPVSVALSEQTSDFRPADSDQLVFVIADDGCTVVASKRLPSQLRDRIRTQLETLVASLGDRPDEPLAQLAYLDDAERQRILLEYNRTETPFDRSACVHRMIEAQAARTPQATALAFEGEEISYGALDARSNQLAAHLRELGVGPEKMVGLYIERCIDLVVGALAVQKAGGAYIPLDPDYPRERIAFMIEDSGVEVLLTQQALARALPHEVAHVVRIDADWPLIAKHGDARVDGGASADNIAYVIYTSGSTGKPKGVMVEHRNVVNFFAGMDQVIPHDPPGTWLAVTSLSFDISVLELFWTLAHGFKVVIHRDRAAQQDASMSSDRPLDFSIFVWGSEDTASSNKYRLMLEAARFADEHGFAAVWTPERHFHAFGGPYPNPSVTGAAIGAATRRVQVRAGSCVAPLHHPARIAEEWAVVDNLTGGRVGVSFASGWQPDDFLLRPENYKGAKQAMAETIDIVRRLWRGEPVTFPGALGHDVEVLTQPRPVQPELPLWVTTAGNPDTYRQAGAMGANVLTHLLGQSLKEVGDKVRLYRTARADNGFDPDAGIVSLMLHTFVGADTDAVREMVREPMKDYLRSSVSLIKNFAWSFSAFKRPDGAATAQDIDLQSLSEEEMDAILNAAFERYFDTSGLFGTPDKCMQLVEQAKRHGIDDIACLIDYGVPTETVLEGLEQLAEVQRRANPQGAARVARHPEGDFSVAALVRDHAVTHLQCTPSMAHMLLMDPDAKRALSSVSHVMVGGEAFPLELGRELAQLVGGSVTNMYGPTETTIWSSTHRLQAAPSSVPIGRPIANTQLYILDPYLQPVPEGVPGELYIGGDGVVRGYHDRPELTQQRFVPDPFRGGQARIYRTGDLARWRGDGQVEYLGRTDFQVKLRGHRIELGEIEAHLNAHDTVSQCVVSAREDTPGDQRLVAYVVAASTADEGELKDFLRARVPDYMVPSHIVELEQLPLTPNGKIDRKALPAPRDVQRAAASYVEPEGELQDLVARAWRETLGLERISASDNFFDIGGHSLLVVQLHRKLTSMIDKPLSLTDLYRFPSIATLAQHLSSDGAAQEARRTEERANRRRELLQKRRRRARGG